jgi:hypothetical protein
MSIFGTDTQNILRTGNDLAKAITPKGLGVRSKQLDRIFNGAIVPTAALHGTLIGACVLLFELQSNFTLANIFLLISFASLVLYRQSQHQDDISSTGFVGGFCAFATGSAIAFGFAIAEAIIVNTIAYAILAHAIIRNPACARELAFTPIYTALFLIISGAHRADAAVIYIPAFVIGIGTLIALRRIVLSYGLFCGMALVLLPKILQPASSFTLLASISAVNILALGLYTAVAVQKTNSNFRNMLCQFVAVATILTTVAILTVEPRPYWMWPAGATLFFLIVFGLSKRKVPPTTFAWIVISIIGAIWLTKTLGFGREWDNRLRILITIGLPISVYFVGWDEPNRFVCNLGRILILIGGAVSLNFANQQQAFFSNYKRPPKASIVDTLLDVIAWHEYALAVAFTLSLLAAILMTISYPDPELRHPTPWWRGLVKPRQAVVLRALYRTGVGWIENIPVIGGILKLMQNSTKGLRYLKTTEAPLGLTDGAIIGVLVLFGLAIVQLASTALIQLDMANGKADTIAGKLWIAETTAWTFCAVFSYCIGLYQRQTLFLFSAVAFALVPFVRLFADTSTLQTGTVVLAVSLTLILCKLLRRYSNFNQ